MWSKGTVANIVPNETYIGWTVFNKKDKKTYGKKFKPKSEWITIKNTHKPIISEELFNRVQRLIKQRQPKNQAAQTTASQHLLSGLMKCGKCDGAYGVTGYGRNRKYAYYNCITYAKKGKAVCPGNRIRADELGAEIISRVKNLLFSDKNMKKLADDINAATKSLRSDYGTRTTGLKKKAGDIQRRIAMQYEAIESGVIDLSLVAPRLKELKNQRDTLQEEIDYCESLNHQHQPIHITKAMIYKFRKEMEQIFMGSNVQEKREFLKKFIEKIVIKEEEIEIAYYTSGITSLP